jgi:protein ImuB
MPMSSVSPSARRRIMALWFPHFPTDRLHRRRLGPFWRSGPRPPPLAVSRREKNRQVLRALDERAEALGLRPGTGAADARGMHPGLEIVEEEPQALSRLLERLAGWCDRYTPFVATDAAEGLLLDISGCAHLFGGERPMAEDALARLERQGFAARAALASTPGAAWAAARFPPLPGPFVASLVPGMEESALAPMPLHALRVEEGVRTGLESVGLRTVGAVLKAPRAPLARRFGHGLLRRLDQALGREDEVIGPRLTPAAISAERHLAEPVGEREMVEALVEELAETIKGDLERRGEGARLLELALFRVDGRVFRLPLKLTRPARDPRLVRRILRERLAAEEGRIEAGFGFDLLRLSVRAAVPFAAAQEDWLDEGGDAGEGAFALFADRLEARLGGEALGRAVAAASHVPERAAQAQPPDLPAGIPPVSRTQPARRRPIRLFAPPERIEVTAEVPDGPPLQFRWRRALYRIAASEGPERIAPEWWRDEMGLLARDLEELARSGEAATRDYFLAEDMQGRRFWLFRRGVYGAGPADGPDWFLHGLFA